jgi:hypothetical protein
VNPRPATGATNEPRSEPKRYLAHTKTQQSDKPIRTEKIREKVSALMHFTVEKTTGNKGTGSNAN